MTSHQKHTLALHQDLLRPGIMNTHPTQTMNLKASKQHWVVTSGTWRDRGKPTPKAGKSYRGKAFNPSTRSCQLCLKEKYHIMFTPGGASLNDRREIFSTYRHRTKLLLCNAWKPVFVSCWYTKPHFYHYHF